MRLPLFPLGLLASGLLPGPLAAQPAGPPALQGSALFRLDQANHGFGPLLPHRIPELGPNGSPTGDIVQIRNLSDLEANLIPGVNGVLPNPILPPIAALPGAAGPGNQYLIVTFTQDIDPASVFDLDPSGLSGNSLGDLVRVEARSPGLAAPVTIPGRVFVGGVTPGRVAVGGALPLLSLVRQDPAGGIAATAVDEDQDGVPDGLGFPGTQTGFAGDADLVSRRALVFVPDFDGDLTTHQTMPVGSTVSLVIRAGLRSRTGGILGEDLLVSATVGADNLPPTVLRDGAGELQVLPPNLSAGIDPATQVEVRFTEPMQPSSVGRLPSFGPSLGGIRLGYGGTLDLLMPYVVEPVSVFSLDRWILTPAMAFPGQGTSNAVCGPLSQVVVGLVGSGVLEDLEANAIADPGSSQFEVGQGPGLVNAPVAPDAILIGRSTPAAVSALDLNGFGASTGSPRFVAGARRPGDSNYPNNPNLQFGTVNLEPGTCTVDGGSAGAFTLTLDSNLDAALTRQPIFSSVADMALGNSLDSVFNNALFPFGCQALGGQICTVDGLKEIAFDLNSNGTVEPNASGANQLTFGTGNLLSWAPHPNPPPLSFPPLCLVPDLKGIEPTETGNSGINLLVPGDPFGDPTANPPVPPSGLFSSVQNAFFEGPTQGVVQLSQCDPYMMRQQVGNFQYLLDEVREEVVVLNSNRQTVVDRISVPGAGRLALSPNLDLLAISQPGRDEVSFLDVDSTSANFHQIVKTTAVGAGPLGIAWQPGNEDILVCNEAGASLSVISAFNLEERQRLTGFLTAPFEVIALPRMQGFAFDRNVYHAYVLQRDGSVAVFESGPDGTSGWGYDDVIGTLPFEFQNPKALSAGDPTAAYGFWVAYEGPVDPSTGQAGAAGVGAISRVVIDAALPGQLALGSMAGTPQFRSMDFGVEATVGEPVLSGIPVDLAFDDLSNISALPGFTTSFSAGAPIQSNGRGLVRRPQGQTTVLPTNRPKVLLAAMPGPNPFAIGVVDVVDLGVPALPLLDTDPFVPGTQSVPVRGARVLLDAFRQ